MLLKLPLTNKHTATPHRCQVRVKLYKGNVVVVGRKSPYSLYDPVIASFEDDQVRAIRVSSFTRVAMCWLRRLQSVGQACYCTSMPVPLPPSCPSHTLASLPRPSLPQGLYNQADAGGFIKLQALRLRTLGVNRNR